VRRKERGKRKMPVDGVARWVAMVVRVVRGVVVRFGCSNDHPPHLHRSLLLLLLLLLLLVLVLVLVLVLIVPQISSIHDWVIR